MKENLEVQQAENKIYYSKSTSGFYFSNINTEIPTDKAEVTQEHYQDLMNKQDLGMLILADKNNYPVAVEPKNRAYKWNGEKWILDETLKAEVLQQTKTQSINDIDNLVGAIYLKFTRFDKEYQLREDQAQAFKNAKYKGEMPEQVEGFAVNNDLTPKQATDLILAQAEKLRYALNELGKLRMQKYKINHQTTIADVEKVRDELINKINAFAQKLEQGSEQ